MDSTTSHFGQTLHSQICNHFDNLLDDVSYLSISSYPSIASSTFAFLRLSNSYIHLTKFLSTGDYRFEINAPIEHSFTLSDFGIFLLDQIESKNVETILSNMNIVVTRMITNYCQIIYMSPSMRITRQITVKKLKSLLTRKITNVHQVIISFKLLKKIKLKIKLFGCKETRSEISIKHYRRHCRQNLFKRKDIIEIKVIPDTDNGNRIQKMSKFRKSEVLFKKGFHKIILTMLEKEKLKRITEIGFILPGKRKEDKVNEHFNYVKLILVKDERNLEKESERSTTVNRVPNNATLMHLRDILSMEIRNIKIITLKFSLKKDTNLIINIRGCLKKEIKIKESITKKQQIFCDKYRLLDKKGLVELQLIPKVKKSDEIKLRFNKERPKEGVFLTKGNHKLIVTIKKADKEEMRNKISEIGLILPEKKRDNRMNKYFEFVKVTIVKVTKTSEKRKEFVINVSKTATVKNLRNVLKKLVRGVTSIIVEVKVTKGIKVRLNLKGCVTKPTPSPKLTTTTPVATTTISDINEQGYRCEKVYNLIKNEKNIIITSKPQLKSLEIKTLRFDAKKPQLGTYLKKGKYSIEISLPAGKSVNVVQLAIVLLNEKSQLNAVEFIRNLKVVVTRSRVSFGKVISSSQIVAIAKGLKVRDLRKLLKVPVTSLSKVTLEFTVVKNIKAHIKMQGCDKFDFVSTTLPLTTTLSNFGIVNTQNFLCLTSVNLLPFTSLFSISVVPNITEYYLSRLISSGRKSLPAAELRQASYSLTVELPTSQSATITQLGLSFPLENPKRFYKSLISSIKVEFLRTRLSFGKIVSTPMTITLPTNLDIASLKNLISQQYTQINRIIVHFTLVKNVNVRLILNGCYSQSQVTLTTQSPVGCVHLNKFYPPNELIYVGSKCDYRICSDGDVLPIFKCNNQWTPWKKCSKLCGSGQSTRRQICTFNPMLKSVDKKALMGKIDETCFDKLEIKPCFEKPCDVSCKHSVWSSWSPCDNSSCKDEHQIRTREEVTNPKHTRCTEPLIESRRCMKPNCSCVENAKMHNCANVICPTDCDHLNDKVKCVTAKTGCVKACICNIGYLYQYGKCVPKSKCECLKPIFKGWTLATTASATRQSATNTTSTIVGEGSSGIGKEGLSGTGVGIKTTRKPRQNTIFEIEPINKDDISKMISNKGRTPPWLPGSTPKPLFYASPPWFAGTTDAGATVKPETEPQTKARIPTPPSGLTASPPDDVGKNSLKRKFLVTAKYSPSDGNQSPTATTVADGQLIPQPPKKPGRIRTTSASSGKNLPSSSSNLQPSSPPQIDNIPNVGSINKLSTIPGLLQTTQSPLAGSDHVKSNSPLTVDCQTCLCTNGVLVCSGPKCHVGNNTWSLWSSWSPCTAICGTGFRRRFRQCLGYGCKDTSSTTPTPGIQRFSPAVGIEAEDKKCLVKECSCVYTREWIKVLLGDDQIKKYGIDIGLAWTEKDDKVGLTSPDELVKSDDVIRSGDNVYLKCSHCKCNNGQMTCTIDCK